VSAGVERLFRWVLLRVGDGLERRRPWHEQPRLLGLVCLLAIRTRLRAHNLYEATATPEGGEAPRGPMRRTAPPARRERTADGSFTDPGRPATGAAGAPFGRNQPLWSGPPAGDLLDPNPREVSEALLARNGRMQEATILNLLAAAWLQFMVHDWMSHGKGIRDERVEVPLPPGDDWPSPGDSMEVVRTPPAEGRPAPGGPPVFSNTETHWWDGSQLYGSTAERQHLLRTLAGDGKLRLEADGRLPLEGDTGIDLTGVNGNWWLGLSLMHDLFAREHNAICDRLAAHHPDWDDERLFQTARMVNAAVMAKIHTVEWTLAILPHPTVQAALRGNWWGILGPRCPRRVRERVRWDFLTGIPGSRRDDHGVPYSITEEFVSVYRMHPLLPDEITLRSAAGGHDDLGRLTLLEMTGRHARGVTDSRALADLWYSFGVQHPGALCLHNFPDTLRSLMRETRDALGAERRVDVSTIDLLRDRERGVPRYNEFRRMLRLAPAESFGALTGEGRDDAPDAARIAGLYGDVERVDVMVGLYAEPLLPGFGFSETAFRIFVLMASRRLKSDPFFTDDFRPEVYSPEGMRWIEDASMAAVVGRHIPELGGRLRALRNPFAPWDHPGNHR
jgi:hypothetical protein